MPVGRIPLSPPLIHLIGKDLRSSTARHDGHCRRFLEHVVGAGKLPRYQLTQSKAFPFVSGSCVAITIERRKPTAQIQKAQLSPLAGPSLSATLPIV